MMEKDLRDIGFEDFLREQTDRHKLTPSEGPWFAIHRRMHTKSRWQYLLAAFSLFGLGVMTGSLLDDGRMAPTPIENTSLQQNGSDGLSGRSEPMPVDLSRNRNGTSEREPFKPYLAYKAEEPQTLADDPEPVYNHPSRMEAFTAATAKPSGMGFSEKAGIPPFDMISLGFDNLSQPTLSIGTAKVLEDAPSKNPIRLNETGSNRKVYDSRRLGWRKMIQVHFSPSVSYRTLIGKASLSNYSYSGLPYSATLGFPTDVNNAVSHKPSLGVEFGASLAYPVTANLRVKAGLQFNANNYEIEAYNYTPEIAPLTAAGPTNFSRPINSVSYYRNFFGFSRTWLRNSHFMISAPIGLELSLPAGRRVSFNLASTVQPTYTLRNNSFLISTNLKNYAQEPSLYRKWNVNAGAEAYLSVSKGSYRWIIGPQVRYQLMSSYKDKYPIREHLVDYGMKFGIQKTLR